MTPLERAEGYQLLAIAFRHPSSCALREELDEIAGDGRGIALELSRALAPHANGDLEGEYNRIFAQNTPVSPYETSYVMGDKGARLGQLTSFYAAFGVRIGGVEREAPDHVGVELEFAALLALKEAFAIEEAGPARAEHLEIVRRARQVLLEEHLGAWVSRFCERVAAVTVHPFYAAAAEVLAGFVERDLAENGWRAARGAVGLPMITDPNEMVCDGAGG